MSESICKFMPAKSGGSNIKAVRFVYETEGEALTQPFVSPIYVMNIVTSGTAKFRFEESAYELKRGDIFFKFPALPYYIDDMEGFEYIYISFMGSGVAELLSKCGVTQENIYYQGFDFLCPIFENSIRRITPQNSNFLSEGVLYYALSFLNEDEKEADSYKEGVFETIVNYVDRHYKEPNMSLGRLSQTFSYTTKYLSTLFKKNMQIGFNTYLNNLRIQLACELIESSGKSIAEIAAECGFNDYTYFLKVFKKYLGKTPTEYLLSVKEG